MAGIRKTRNLKSFWGGAALVAATGLLCLACFEPRRETSTATAAPGPQPSGQLIERVENGLIPMTEAAEPQWDERATLADRMRHYAVPGVGVAAIDNFAIDWSRGYGTLRAGGDESVTPETLFHAGSIAKCLSAAATLTLVEDGRLGLDRDIAEDLRSWQIPESDFTREEKVTLRRLLSHTGGLEDGFTNRSSGDPVPDYFTAEGSASSVSLVELLEPLGLPSSTYEQPIPSAQRPRAAVEHDLSGRPIGGDRLHIPFRAAGGLWTTPSDLAAFVIEILQAHRGESERILSQSITEEMLKRQIEIENNPVAEAAGIGFQLGGAGEDSYLVHTGGTWGSTAILWAYPERGQGAVIMTNSASGSLLRFEILLAIAREYGWPIEP